MRKLARKKSPDPYQEDLRTKKDGFNQAASTFIAQLIAFKRGINGRGDNKVGIPPSNIKDPLPPEVGSYLSQMVDRFNDLSSDAIKIIRQQESYSSSRNKGKSE